MFSGNGNNRKAINLGTALIYGTVFSGASDTTLMNTVRMACYNHYTLTRNNLKFEEDYKLYAKGDDFMVFIRNPKRYSSEYYE